MSIFSWIILALIAGFFSNQIGSRMDLSWVIEVVVGASALFVAYYITSREKRAD